MDRIEEFIDRERVFNLSSRKLTEIEQTVLSYSKKALNTVLRAKELTNLKFFQDLKCSPSLKRFPLKSAGMSNASETTNAKLNNKNTMYAQLIVNILLLPTENILFFLLE